MVVDHQRKNIQVVNSALIAHTVIFMEFLINIKRIGVGKMKIKTTVTEIECNAEELRQSNSLSDAFCGFMRRTFNGPISNNYEEQEDEDNACEES